MSAMLGEPLLDCIRAPDKLYSLGFECLGCGPFRSPIHWPEHDTPSGEGEE